MKTVFIPLALALFGTLATGCSDPTDETEGDSSAVTQAARLEVSLAGPYCSLDQKDFAVKAGSSFKIQNHSVTRGISIFFDWVDAEGDSSGEIIDVPAGTEITVRAPKYAAWIYGGEKDISFPLYCARSIDDVTGGRKASGAIRIRR